MPGSGSNRVAFGINDFGDDTRQRAGRGARLGGRKAGQRRNQDHARLRLPPRVNDRAPPAANVVVIPNPGLGVDRLAYSSDQPQSGKRMPGGQFGAPAHERANRRRRRIENVHAIFIDHGPEAVAIRIIRSALVHQ